MWTATRYLRHATEDDHMGSGRRNIGELEQCPGLESRDLVNVSPQRLVLPANVNFFFYANTYETDWIWVISKRATVLFLAALFQTETSINLLLCLILRITMIASLNGRLPKAMFLLVNYVQPCAFRFCIATKNRRAHSKNDQLVSVPVRAKADVVLRSHARYASEVDLLSLELWQVLLRRRLSQFYAALVSYSISTTRSRSFASSSSSEWMHDEKLL